jgi:hypothetical protein
MDMPAGVRDAVAERIVSLADDYAARIVAAIPSTSDAELHAGISGAMLSFLAEAVEVAA